LALFRIRWNSEYLINLAIKENSFCAEYRLDPKRFKIIHELIAPMISVNQSMAQVSMSKSGSAPISSDSRLGAALIMLAGGRRIEAMRTHGLSKTMAYDNLHAVVKAINSHAALAIVPNNSTSELKKRSSDFQMRSSHGLFKYCTGAVDGLAIHIRAPSRQSTQNQTRFFSGSKKKFCLNFQGVCDANCKFIGFTCKHVGSTNDAEAYETCSLKHFCESLPFPYHWNGDPAYTLSESMMIPFSGVNLHITDACKEWFNFWHSQVRITIERCFGIFIQRWGIFWQALKFDLHNVFAIIEACCRLHNFCINQKLPILDSSYQPPSIANLK
jgi:hypothetical protein